MKYPRENATIVQQKQQTRAGAPPAAVQIPLVAPPSSSSQSALKNFKSDANRRWVASTYTYRYLFIFYVLLYFRMTCNQLK